MDEETGLPTIALEYEMIGDEIIILIVKDKESGAALAHGCKDKGPSDDWVVKQLAKDIESSGRTDVVLKTAGEPAMIAMQTAICRG